MRSNRRRAVAGIRLRTLLMTLVVILLLAAVVMAIADAGGERGEYRPATDRDLAKGSVTYPSSR